MEYARGTETGGEAQQLVAGEQSHLWADLGKDRDLSAYSQGHFAALDAHVVERAKQGTGYLKSRPTEALGLFFVVLTVTGAGSLWALVILHCVSWISRLESLLTQDLLWLQQKLTGS